MAGIDDVQPIALYIYFSLCWCCSSLPSPRTGRGRASSISLSPVASPSSTRASGFFNAEGHGRATSPAAPGRNHHQLLLLVVFVVDAVNRRRPHVISAASRRECRSPSPIARSPRILAASPSSSSRRVLLDTLGQRSVLSLVGLGLGRIRSHTSLWTSTSSLASIFTNGLEPAGGARCRHRGLCDGDLAAVARDCRRAHPLGQHRPRRARSVLVSRFAASCGKRPIRRFCHCGWCSAR